MGAKSCKGIIGDDIRWHANKILWDCSEKKELAQINGEFVHKIWDDVEDCVSGIKGQLTLTTLRLIWKGYPDPSIKGSPPNISIGLKVIQSIQFNVNESKHYGRTRTLSVSTRFLEATYDFSFAMGNGIVVNEAFHAFEAWNKRFKASRVFRETLVREMKMTKSAVGLLLYHPETLIQEIPRVENIAASKKYSGKMFLTSHRLIWVSSRSAIVNVSIPFIELRMIATRNTPYGIGLVVCASNVSLSQKACHLRQGVREGEDSLVLGFKLPSISLVQEVHKYCQQRQKHFRENPFYMPDDGRVIHRLGRWMIVDEDTWRDAMGLNDPTDEEEDSPMVRPSNAPFSSTSGDIQSMDENETREFDDPLTPSAQPVQTFDIGNDGIFLDDLAQFEDPVSSNVYDQNAAPTTADDSTITGNPTEPSEGKHNVSRKRPVVPTSPAAAAYRVDPTCVICLTKPPQLAFDPCGHMCACKSCGDGLKECPMCRQAITKTLKVYVVA